VGGGCGGRRRRVEGAPVPLGGTFFSAVTLPPPQNHSQQNLAAVGKTLTSMPQIALQPVRTWSAPATVAHALVRVQAAADLLAEARTAHHVHHLTYAAIEPEHYTMMRHGDRPSPRAPRGERRRERSQPAPHDGQPPGRRRRRATNSDPPPNLRRQGNTLRAQCCDARGLGAGAHSVRAFFEFIFSRTTSV